MSSSLVAGQGASSSLDASSSVQYISMCCFLFIIGACVCRVATKVGAKVVFLFYLTIFLPKYFIGVCANVCEPCHGEEEIAEPVDENDGVGGYLCGVGECCDAPFSAAAHCACDVELGCFHGASGEHEPAEWGECGVGGVNHCLKA